MGESVTEGDPSQDSPPPHIHHHPQFIFIEEEKFQESHSQRSGAASEGSSVALEQLGNLRYSWHVRLTALVFAVIAVVALFFALVLLLFSALGVCCTGGFYTPARRLLSRMSHWCRKAAVLALGFVVAILSPAFGFAIIVLYFILAGERLNQELLQRMMHPP